VVEFEFAKKFGKLFFENYSSKCMLQVSGNTLQ